MQQGKYPIPSKWTLHESTYKDYLDRRDVVIEMGDVYSIIDHIEALNRDAGHEISYADGDRQTWAHGDTLKNYTNTRSAIYDLKMPDNYIKAINQFRDELLLKDEIKKLQEKAVNFRRKKKYGISGGELDIDKLMVGNPEHWFDNPRIRENNIVDIHFNGGLLCDKDENDFFKLGAMIVVTTELLQTAGFAVRIHGFYQQTGLSDDNHVKDVIFMFPIKQAEEPLDIWRIASFGLPGFFRSIMFTLFYAYIPQPSWGLGRQGQPDAGQRQWLNIKNYFGSTSMDGDNVLVVKELLKYNGII